MGVTSSLRKLDGCESEEINEFLYKNHLTGKILYLLEIALVIRYVDGLEQFQNGILIFLQVVILKMRQIFSQK